MILEELAAVGATLSDDQIKEYGFTKEAEMGNAVLYTRGKRRFFMESKNESYKVTLIYDLPKLE